MLRFTRVLHDPNGIVSKLIFEDEKAIAEAVVYRYGNRGVICFSCQSGCRVGCRFCGTGRHFIRDLTEAEIELQIDTGLAFTGVLSPNQIQLMSMSMGEPWHNWTPVASVARKRLDAGFHFYVSTVAPQNIDAMSDSISLGRKYLRFGLQFSLHATSDKARRHLMPDMQEYPLDYLTIMEMWELAERWKKASGRRVYFNFVAGKDMTAEAENLAIIVGGHHLTCSVLCDKNGLSQGNAKFATDLMGGIKALDADVEMSVFDPAGQDTIGGGCGQLLYVQEKLKGVV